MPRSARPDPDHLLARITAEDQRRARGRLKVFLGAAAGVGKTFAMLEAARAQREAGIDVVVGWVQPHGRAETEALLEGLETVPPRVVTYHGVALDELDVDAVLARRPRLAVVDELAHTNAPGSRHPKRWQDVEDLLDAGIDVYTTVNIQHIESLNDVVAQITGVVVRETVPDRMIEEADEIALIDLAPDDLLQRLREGKVYVPAQAAAAAEQFFRKGNLIALRELALRHTAERVDAQMRDYRRDHAIDETWPATERILVCVSASPLAPRLVRAGRRLAARLQAEWVVLFVERASYGPRTAAQRDHVARTLRLAESLGAETVTLAGDAVSAQILDYARARNASKIVLGKPERPRWREILFGSIVDEVVRGSGAIDVFVMTGEAGDDLPLGPHSLARTSPWPGYARAAGAVGVATLAAQAMFPFLAEANLVMVYLLGVVWVARREGRGPSTLSAVLSVLAFDFFFVLPHHTFTVADTEYLIMFAVMLVVGLAISTSAARLRRQADASHERERRTAALYALSRDLAQLRGLDNLADACARHIHDVFGGDVAVLLPRDGRLAAEAMRPAPFDLPADELAVAAWVMDHGRPAGQGTDTLPGAEAIHVPLVVGQQVLGVLSVDPGGSSEPVGTPSPEQMHLLEAFAHQTALAVARARLADEAQQARVQAEAERLRGTLLGSISHDLRTPLAAIAGSAETLLADGAALDDGTRRDLLTAIHEQTLQLSRLVANVLDMTRLESGGIALQREWQSCEEMIGAALARLESFLGRRPVNVIIAPDLPEVACDIVLIEQALFNLIENAAKHTPPDTPIDVSARERGGAVEIAVADRGSGLPPGDPDRLFDKFYRAVPGRRSTRESPTSNTAAAGAGLGLAICRAVVEAHGGRITAENRTGGGAVFRFSLPDTRAAGSADLHVPDVHVDALAGAYPH